MLAFAGLWNAALGPPTPDAVAVPGHDAVGPIAQAARKPGAHRRQEAPRPAQLSQAAQHGIAAVKDALGWGTGRLDYQDSLREGSYAAPLQQVAHCRVGLRGKAQAVSAVAAEQPANDVVAEAAVAVKDDQEPPAGFLSQTHCPSHFYLIPHPRYAMHNPA